MKNVTYYLLCSVWFLLSLLPFWVHYLLSDFIYIIIYKVIGYRIKVVRRNLESSFPEKPEAELRQIERRFYHCLCDYFVESVKLMTMSEAQMRRRMVFKGTKEVEACVADGQSCAVYLGHLFNWEWITSLPFWVPKEAQCGQLYHALESPVFDRLFLNLRQRWGAECIALVDILRKTVEYKHRQQPTVIGYIGDQVPHWNNIHHWCQFLNHDTPVMTGAERIAVKNNQALFYIDMKRVKRGYYEAEFKLITRQPKTLREFESVDIYFQMLEQSIRRQPELWLWSHDRWKRTREEFNRRFQVVDGKVVPKEETEVNGE
ncbi:MAG: lysophospholipid acyltransferase family protein [Prevotella sp.]|nr:lysophospholipid acyltransferase family protein [Prevotella sp.]